MNLNEPVTEKDFESVQSQVTMKEYVESKAAKSLYEKMLYKTRLLVTIPAIIFAIMVIAFVYEMQSTNNLGTITVTTSNTKTLLILCVISFVALVVCLGIRAKKLEPYRELYKIARENDDIRHDEKVRYLEVKRLESTNYINENSKENIKATISEPKLSNKEK